MKKLRIFVDVAMPPDVLAEMRQATAGHELLLPAKPAASVLVQAEADPQIYTADVAFGQPDPAAIGRATGLKWVHISSSGITRYDTPQFRAMAAQRNLAVTNSAAVYAEACAVHAMSFMLAQARRLPLGLSSRLANGSPPWHALRAASTTLRGQSVLIVGYGAIGTRLAELLAPLGMAVRAYRRRPRGDEAVPLVPAGQLDEALAQADHVMNILPDSPQTRRFFGRDRLAALKSGAVFYNIGRGSTVDQEALADALRSGRLDAAWLDVSEPEPLPDDHPLWSLPNCHITPHTAGGHDDEFAHLARHFLENFRRFASGHPLLDRVM